MLVQHHRASEAARTFGRIVAIAALVICEYIVQPAGVSVVQAAEPDFPVNDGRFFSQAAGGTGLQGFAVTNQAGVRFWDAFQANGGVAALGYPVSRRFEHEGFTTQAMQKGVLQWRPEKNSVSFVNVFDDLQRMGRGDWLLSARSTPPPITGDIDAGKEWTAIVRDRQALMDARPSIRTRYRSLRDPMSQGGLPTSAVQDMGNHYAIRLQRAVIQEWKIDVPWAKAGETTVANGGDIFKESGAIPGFATEPESPTQGGTNLPPLGIYNPPVSTPTASIPTITQAPTAIQDARIVSTIASVRASPSTASLELARVFRNATVELTGSRVQEGSTEWVSVRLWNAINGWLPVASMTVEPYPAKDNVAGGGYRGAIKNDPSPSISLKVDAPMTTVATTTFSNEPDGSPISTVSIGASVRLLEYRAGKDARTWYRVRVGDQEGWATAANFRLLVRDPLAPSASGRSMSAPVAGKGMWATYDILDRTPVQTIVNTARANGLTHIYLQVGRSNLGFYGRDGLNRLLPAAHAAGIHIIGWVYPFLKDPVADVNLTVEVARYLTPDGHRIDALAADVEENMASSEIYAYGQLVRALIGEDMSMIVATYPPESFHGKTYPFATVASTWNVIAPMDYYHRPETSYTYEEAYGYVSRSISLIRERAGRTVVVAPIGHAYSIGWPNEVGPSNPTGEETRGMLTAARDTTVGISFFEWAHTTAEQWRAIGQFPWSKVATP